MSTFPQEIIGRFQLLAQLGSGGMGAVYKAQDLKLKRVVALKIMHPSLSHNQDFRDRFLQEAQSGARLKHPGIVQVHDVIEEGDYLIIVEDFIAGENLVSRMKSLRAENRTMPVEEAMELVRQVSLALAYAHQNGVLHRDIKPANILLEPVSGEKLPYRPVLTDLGLAKLLVGGLETQAGISMGTPAYMAPEQALGQPADARSDVYALGVLLYELITGKLPFPLKTISEAIRCHMYEPPPVPPPLPAGFPTELSLLLKKTLQRNRDARPANAEIFAVLLGSLLEAEEESLSEPGEEAEDKRATDVSTGLVHEGGTGNLPEAESGRGPSIWNKFKSQPEEQNVDQVEIFAPGGDAHIIKLGLEPLIIGREEISDIVLDDLKASRKHARLEYDGQNYRLTDLNSTNGTFMGKTRLQPGVPEIWMPEKPLRIGEHYLRLVRAKERMNLKQARGEGTLVDLKIAAVSQGGGRIGVVVPQTNLTVEAGSTVMLTFMVVNQGSQTDFFTVAVEGLPVGWAREIPVPLQLSSGKSQEVTLPIQPPRQPESRATRYPFTLSVATKSNPEETVENRCALTILPFAQFTSQLQPQRLQSGKPGRVSVQNQGNAPETFIVAFTSQGDELVFLPTERKLRIAEGKSETTEVTARPKKKRWFGGEKIHPFTASVTVEHKPAIPGAPPGTPQVHQGELLSRGWSWLWLLLAGLCLVLAVGAAVAIPLLRDADHDGLNTLEERRYGTNPDEADSDGDTLSDGIEVQSLRTNPLSRDTDADKLDDFKEVSGCTDPLLSDSDGDGIMDGEDPEPCMPRSTTRAPTEVKPTDKPTNSMPTGQSPVGVSASASILPTESTEGCPFSMRFTGILSANGTTPLTYRWERSDGSQSETQTVVFDQAGSLTVTDEVQGNSSGEYYDRLHILQPKEFTSSPAYFRLNCLPMQASTFTTQVSVVPISYAGVCPAVFAFSGTITADGPAEVRYNWSLNIGATSEEFKISFSQAGTQKVGYLWNIADSGTYSLRLHLTAPVDSLSDEVVFSLDCIRTPITVENAAQILPMRSLSGFENPVTSLVFAPDSSFLATASSTEVWTWSIPEGILQLQTQNTGNVTGIAFSPDGAYFAISARDGWVDVKSVDSASNINHLYYASSPDNESIDGLAFASYSGVLAAFSQEGKIFFWDLYQEKWMKTLEGSPIRGTILSLAFSKSGQYLAAGTFAGDTAPLGTSYDDDVYIWQPKTYDFKRIMTDPGCFWVSKLVFSPVDEALLAVGNISDGNVRLWRVSDGTVLRKLPIGDAVQALAFSPDGNLLATNSGSQVALWRVSTGERLRLLQGHAGAVLNLAFSPDGNFLASGSEDRTVILWSVGGR